MSHLTEIQIQIDQTKQMLAANAEYATLSGLNMLPRNWVVQPYICSTQTGIKEVINEDNNVTEFIFDFGVKIKKHYIDE